MKDFHMYLTFIDLYAGIRATHEAVGTAVDHTPLSATAPNCSGWLLAKLTDAAFSARALPLLFALRDGRLALYHRPAAPALLVCPDERGRRVSNPGSTALVDGVSRWRSSANTSRDITCWLCDRDALLGPHHVLCVCTHPAVMAARTTMLATLPLHAAALARHLAAAQLRWRRDTGDNVDGEGVPRPPPASHPFSAPSLDSLAALLRAVDWTSPDATFSLLRLLLLVPWPAAAVRETPAGTSCTLSRSLGAIFDSTMTPHRYTRPAVKTWAAWAYDYTHSIVQAWADAVDERGYVEGVAGIPHRAPPPPPATPTH